MNRSNLDESSLWLPITGASDSERWQRVGVGPHPN
jgi:hypothetical protein